MKIDSKVFNAVFNQVLNNKDFKEFVTQNFTNSKEDIKAQEIKPNVMSIYKHNTSGKLYILKEITNKDSPDSVKFPETAVYTSIDTKKTWSRPLVDFLSSFKNI